MSAMPDFEASQGAQMRNSMLKLGANLEPIFDAADSIRADMARRGWSPTAAEAAALTWLQGALAFVWVSATVEQTKEPD